MYAGENERKTVDESYSSAVGAGSLRVGNDHTVRTPGDLIAAAGMNRHRMGLALERLVSEWNAGAVPKPGDVPDVKVLARKMAEERVEEDIRCEYTDRGLTVSEKRAMRAAVKIEKCDLDLAHAEQQRLHARSADWSLEEHKLRFQRLKTLPAVRDALVFYVAEKGWEGGVHMVAAVLQHFLSPKCRTCGGSGLKVIEGTGGRSGGKRCKDCRENPVPGEMKVPHGGRGKALLAYITACTGQSAHDLREGAQRLRRGTRNVEDRHKQRSADEATTLRRADAEAQADAKADTSADAAHFAASMARTRQ